jgi:hypothetical protein
MNPIVRHSNGGMSRICSDNAGHVAQSGIARPPMSVQCNGCKGEARRGVRLSSACGHALDRFSVYGWIYRCTLTARPPLRDSNPPLTLIHK